MLRQCKCINIILLLFINLFHTQITLSQWRVWFAFNFGLSILIMILLYFQHVIKFISLFKQCFTDYRKGVFFKRLPRLLETPWFSFFRPWNSFILLYNFWIHHWSPFISLKGIICLEVPCYYLTSLNQLYLSNFFFYRYKESI